MDDWLRLPYTLSTWFVEVCYATLLASLVLCPLLLLRRLAGRRLRPLSRMALWYVLLVLMLLLPASMHWGTGFTFVGRVGPDYALPPVSFTFRALGRLVSDGGGPFWQPSGALRLHVFASLSPNRGLFVHEMDGMPVLLVWLAGAALSLLLPAAGYLRLRQKLRGADRPDEKTAALVTGCARELFGLEPPAVRVVSQARFPELSCPCLAGWRRPVLILVREQWEALTPEERRSVAAHELTHLRHRDNALNLLLVALQAVQWFNPLIPFAFRRLRQDLECLRDQEVLEKLPEEEGLAYAGAIVRLARMRRLRRRPALHSGMLSASGLGFRVELLGETARYPRPQEAALLLLFLLLMLTPLLLRTLPGLFSASIAW